jgi:hypothetical protein
MATMAAEAQLSLGGFGKVRERYTRLCGIKLPDMGNRAILCADKLEIAK